MILWVVFRHSQIFTGGAGCHPRGQSVLSLLIPFSPDKSVDLVFSVPGAEYGIL